MRRFRRGDAEGLPSAALERAGRKTGKLHYSLVGYKSSAEKKELKIWSEMQEKGSR